MSHNGVYHSKIEYFMDLCKMLFVAFIIALLIRTFIVQPYIIPSGSMLNTLQIGDRLLVCKFSYGIHLPFVSNEIVSLGEPKHDDIVVFPYPVNPKIDFIKRVIGLPGDTIEIKNRTLYRNGNVVNEPYAIYKSSDVTFSDMSPVTVPDGKVFVLGDNRDDSADSRKWGFVDKKTIVGKAVIVFWSSTDWTKIKWDRIGKLL